MDRKAEEEIGVRHGNRGSRGTMAPRERFRKLTIMER